MEKAKTASAEWHAGHKNRYRSLGNRSCRYLFGNMESPSHEMIIRLRDTSIHYVVDAECTSSVTLSGFENCFR